MKQSILEKVEDVCKQIYDPEIPQNIWDLGFVYSIEVDNDNNVDITMTLTTPSCPVGPEFLNTVKMGVQRLEEVNKCNVELVWDPAWGPHMMTEETQTLLGLELNRPMLNEKENWE